MEKIDFYQLIKNKFSTLSPGQKKIAEFLVDHRDEAVLKTAFQLGKKVGVSETTVIRFSYALGFSGFSDMQDMIQQEWITTKQHSTQHFQIQNEHTVGDMYAKVIEKESQILQQLLNQLNRKNIDQAIEELIQADRVYIGGFGASFAAAHWLYYSLSQLRENVFLSQHVLPEQLCELKEGSVVIVFSFPRYTKDSLKLAEWVKKQHAKLISITDRQLSPIGQISDITITTEEQMESGYFSFVSVICILEMIIAGMHSRDHVRISKRQEMIEMLYSNQEMYLE
ncbi:MurR/RpiR family transcriptional regulator [Domibacillus mangrovi]|uniref:RpiR family transcriptional regulator n=1 Tax=Domibacillus mangrovi TaxID=1714354 RepID=A0A1Q5P5M8_9BACI|nr:MurR/RpiR family transcriptional regulator [Domibacillus mangrovi]OKL37451.1 RpiR family transcriptional regulator [Domibacillus mangrovi]